ncbi:MAG: single-stranded DNA-binding protein [Gemmatimonadetes bacterium]|nr:single-stranded DNA-binding protein [Gemmatimonadota bacterium]
MSRSLNKVTLIGNLGADPEIRTTSTGSKVASFSIATSRSWGGQGGGEKQEKTEWHKCVAWNAKGPGTGLADIIERYCKKGEKLYVEGRIEYRQYQDKENQTKYITEINVREIMLLGGKGGGGDFDSSSAPSRPRSSAPAKGGASSAPSGDFEEFPGGLEAEDDLPF